MLVLEVRMGAFVWRVVVRPQAVCCLDHFFLLCFAAIFLLVELNRVGPS